MPDKRINDVKHIMEESIPTMLKACDNVDKFSPHLRDLEKRLEESANAILEHVDHGDLSDQELNSKLWHDLYNIQHMIQQVSKFKQESVKQFLEESLKIINPLCDMRPDKE